MLQSPPAPSDRPATRGYRRRVGILANWHYWPNLQAWRYFVAAWLPTLRARHWSVVVAGLGCDVLEPAEGVRFLGAVDNLADFYDHIDVAAVPVHRGGGIKVKAIEAMCWGKHILGTSHVRDGLPPELARYVHDLAEIEDLLTWEAAPRKDLAMFTEEAFRSSVTRLLAERD